MTATTKKDVIPAPAADERREILKRAAAGDESALPQVREIFRDPEAVARWEGDLAAGASRRFVKALVQDNLAVGEAILSKVGFLRDELLAGGSSPLEKLLVECVCVGWLWWSESQMRYAHVQLHNGGNLKRLDYLQRRINHSHRRYVQAVRALATVRKTLSP